MELLASVVVVSIGFYAILNLLALQVVLNVIKRLSKKELKDQQEIKTRLHWAKTRQKKLLKRHNGK